MARQDDVSRLTAEVEQLRERAAVKDVSAELHATQQLLQATRTEVRIADSQPPSHTLTLSLSHTLLIHCHLSPPVDSPSPSTVVGHCAASGVATQ